MLLLPFPLNTSAESRNKNVAALFQQTEMGLMQELDVFTANCRRKVSELCRKPICLKVCALCEVQYHNFRRIDFRNVVELQTTDNKEC